MKAETTVVNLRETEHYKYIGRGSKWGNPFVIGQNGDRETCIRKYEEYARNNTRIMNDLHELEGHALGCFCKPLPCHGDVLLKLLHEGGFK